MILPGDIILVRTNTFFGKVIRKVTKSHWNHVGIAVCDKSLVEADFIGGVQIGKINQYNNIRVLRYNGADAKDRMEIAGTALSSVGHNYDYWAIIGWFIGWLVGYTGLSNKVQAKTHFYCSEHVLWVYRKVGKDLFTMEKNVSPGEIELSKMLCEVK